MKFIDRIFNNYKRSDKYTEDVVNFANGGNFYSKTQYFIWVDLKNFKTNIFKGSQNNWTLVQSYLCSIGKPSTPTPKGTHVIGIKGLYFGVSKGYKCFYYTQFKGNYLFHSIIYNLDGSIRDGRLGMSISDGCIRLAKENAKWIYDNIPIGTKVYIS